MTNAIYNKLIYKPVRLVIMEIEQAVMKNIKLQHTGLCQFQSM